MKTQEVMKSLPLPLPHRLPLTGSASCSTAPAHPGPPTPHACNPAGQDAAAQHLAWREPPAPTVLELPWLSLSKRNFRFDLGEFLFFISAGRRGKAKKKSNNL